MPVFATDRLRVRYTTPNAEHSMTFSKVLGVADNVFIAAVRDIVDNMVLCQFTGTSWYSAEYQVAGQNFSNPIPWTPIIQQTAGINPTQNDTAGEYVGFVGRSNTTAKRVRYFLFGVPFGPGTNMRLGTGASNLLDDVYSELVSNSQSVGAIDGTPVTWKAYFNLGINDFWIRKVRA